MKIIVAGAGSGKTQNFVSIVEELRVELDSVKNIYCLAFTNNAVDCIKNRLNDHETLSKNNVIVSTIHSFLYNEIIKPYRILIYGQHLGAISRIDLPNDCRERQYEISRLKKNGFLHQKEIPKEAKWIFCGKSKDDADVKNKRKIVNGIIAKYCGAICIDEAQDIDSDIMKIIKLMDALGVKIVLVGDPKQDIKGIKVFRDLVEERSDSVIYKDRCYRCPVQHLRISNTIVNENEKQISKKSNGKVEFNFGTRYHIRKVLERLNFDLIYISRARNNYVTRPQTSLLTKIEDVFECLRSVVQDRIESESIELCYYLAYEIFRKHQKLEDDLEKVIKDLMSSHMICLSEEKIKKLIDIINAKKTSEVVSVRTIDSVKGLEGDRCLFILTMDLARHLFGKANDDNATRARLYVALTRSRSYLLIHIDEDVERIMCKEDIITYFNSLGVNELSI